MVLTKNQTEILQKQAAEFKFCEDGVKYFSLSTQHGKANTFDEAITSILKSDTSCNGMSAIAYVIDEYFPKDIPKCEPVKEEDFKKYIEMLKKNALKDYE